MSRVGNKLIPIAQGVNISVDDNNHVIVVGPKGKIAYDFPQAMTIEVADNEIKISRPSDSKMHKALHGTTRSLLHNMIEGVTNGFSKALEIRGTGYRAAIKGKTLEISAGYAKPVVKEIPSGIEVEVPNPTEIIIRGIDKQSVGQYAAEIRAIRKPEPYLGKGIRYKGEVVHQKEGKKA
ncbi:MAG: 50S ribosomal protein L6 [Bacilli bacterium]|nr:50S ribosomal protein L6 [Bacilli bacterium]MDD4076441.1 50S ribosomal protein L6 [Bacilli bacterium]MDD4387970.1 50S ribosomal protein L6 [Bacilli bacterium]